MRSVTGKGSTRRTGRPAEDEFVRYLRATRAKVSEHQKRQLEEIGRRVIEATRSSRFEPPQNLDPVKLAQALDSVWMAYIEWKRLTRNREGRRAKPSRKSLAARNIFEVLCGTRTREC